MPFDWAHLARALREARMDAGLTQADVAALAGVNEGTVKNLEGRRKEFSRWPASADAVATALGKPDGWARQQAHPDPTARRENTDEPSAGVKTTDSDVLASTGADLPPAIRLMLEDGEVIDYTLVTLPGESEPSGFVAFVHPSTYESGESRAELRRRLSEFRRIAARVSRPAPELSTPDTPPDAHE